MLISNQLWRYNSQYKEEAESRENTERRKTSQSKEYFKERGFRADKNSQNLGNKLLRIKLLYFQFS